MTTPSNYPTTSTDLSVWETLISYRDKRVFFDPLFGNNGDRLIEMGSRTVLHAIGINPITSPDDADLIVLNGGASMTTVWKHGFDILLRYNQEHANTPLLVLPASFEFEDTDFTSLFEARRAPATLYARERPSRDILQETRFPGAITIGLDHDMAFALRDTAYLRNLQRQSSNSHLLIVERSDAESVTGGSPPKPIGPAIKKFLPNAFRSWARHLVWDHRARREGASTNFAKAARTRAVNDHPEFIDLPIYNADISLKSICGFRHFGKLVAQSAGVITTRLHVAILASMLGKPVYLKSGSFHKITGIYDYSLSDGADTHLI